MQRRVVKGFAAAAITPVIVACVAALCYAGSVSTNMGAMARFALPVTIVIAVPLAVGATLLIAVPAHYFAARFRRRSLLFYVLGGTAISIVVAALVALDIYRVPPTSDAYWIFNALTLAVALISGPLAAAVFWAVARPDRINGQDAPAPGP